MRAPAIPAPRSIAFVPPSDNETPPHHGTLPLTTTRRPILIHICRTGNDNHRPSRHGPFFIIRGQPADPSMDDARKQLWHDVGGLFPGLLKRDLKQRGRIYRLGALSQRRQS